MNAEQLIEAITELLRKLDPPKLMYIYTYLKSYFDL